MFIDITRVAPRNPLDFVGFKVIRIFATLYLIVMVTRSCIHLFASDGGANSIAGIDVSVEGGDNIVAIFHQWGAIQLILALLLLALMFLYPGLTPIVLLTLVMDPVLRFVAGQSMPLTTEGTPPGESWNLPSLILVATLFLASLVKKRVK